jgi:hypothetical protein
VAAGGHQLAAAVEREVAGSREKLLLVLLDDEVPIAGQGHVGRLLRGSQLAGRVLRHRLEHHRSAAQIVERLRAGRALPALDGFGVPRLRNGQLAAEAGRVDVRQIMRHDLDPLTLDLGPGR